MQFGVGQVQTLGALLFTAPSNRVVFSSSSVFSLALVSELSGGFAGAAFSSAAGASILARPSAPTGSELFGTKKSFFGTSQVQFSGLPWIDHLYR